MTAPTLTQTQIIRALADALTWFERELAWGVEPAALTSLTGRIGELYAAMITRGQMALATNQRGYDVVSAEGEHISVKTITSSNHVTFNASTFDLVDRVIILRINVDDDSGTSIEELLDASATDARALCREMAGAFQYMMGRKLVLRQAVDPGTLRVTARAPWNGHEIVRFENAAIRIMKDGQVMPLVVLAFLRPIAAQLGIELTAPNGENKTTQQLGMDVIRALNARKSES